MGANVSIVVESERKRHASTPGLASSSAILLVDDEPSNLLALEAILAPLGQRLVRATSGEQALWRALKEEFAVVLLDVQMPGMDGFECAELLRRRPRTRDVPIIFLTAISKGDSFISRGYGVGAVDYLVKPYDPDILRSKVMVFVELARKNELIRSQHAELMRMREREIEDFKQLSDRRYADLADSMPQIVWRADENGKVTYVNRRWRDLAGTSLDFRAVVHPDDLAGFEEGWQEAIRSSRPWEDELRFGSASTGYRFHLVRAIPRKKNRGAIDSWIGTSTDIHERVRASRALHMLADASRRLGDALGEPSEIADIVRHALPMLGDAALFDDRTGSEPVTVTVVSEGTDPKLFDDPRFELGPANVSYSGNPEVHLDVAADLRSSSTPVRVVERESSRWNHLGFLRELNVAGYMCLPLTARGHDLGTLTFVRMTSTYDTSDLALAEDLTRRIAVAIEGVRLHETTERRRVELELANKSKDVFLATLSHELRTPLNAIVGWTDMMRSGTLSEEELTRASETIDRNAHALSQLVADLLDVSRIVTGTLKIESQPVALTPIVEAAIEAARPQCKIKNITFDVSLENVGTVNGDAGRLRQIVANVLSNAVKFSAQDGTISVRLFRDADMARVEVRDDGEGIEPELLPYVFERFRQAEAARTRGLGLGLAIVKHLVEDHAGRVWAESRGKGKGTTLTVELPIANPPVTNAGEALEEPVRTTSASSGQPELRGVHALLVEDDPDGNELIMMILQRYGARVTSVATAGAALEALDRELPDVIVSDIGLPDIDGVELIKIVRARPGGADLPAVALTAYASRQDAVRVISAGFDAHVAKPVQPAVLGAELVRVLAHASSGIKNLTIPPPAT